MDNIYYFDDLKCNKQRLLSKYSAATPVETSQDLEKRGCKEVLIISYKRLYLNLWKKFVTCLVFDRHDYIFRR